MRIVQIKFISFSRSINENPSLSSRSLPATPVPPYKKDDQTSNYITEPPSIAGNVWLHKPDGGTQQHSRRSCSNLHGNTSWTLSTKGGEAFTPYAFANTRSCCSWQEMTALRIFLCLRSLLAELYYITSGIIQRRSWLRLRRKTPQVEIFTSQ